MLSKVVVPRGFLYAFDLGGLGRRRHRCECGGKETMDYYDIDKEEVKDREAIDYHEYRDGKEVNQAG